MCAMQCTKLVVVFLEKFCKMKEFGRGKATLAQFRRIKLVTEREYGVFIAPSSELKTAVPKYSQVARKRKQLLCLFYYKGTFCHFIYIFI